MDEAEAYFDKVLAGFCIVHAASFVIPVFYLYFGLKLPYTQNHTSGNGVVYLQ
jgi:hypothetical protein